MSSNRTTGDHTPVLGAASRHELRHRLRTLGLPLVLEPAVRRRSLPARTIGVHTALALLFVSIAVLEVHLEPQFEAETVPEMEAIQASTGLVFWVTAATVVALASPLLGWVAAISLRLVARRWRDAVGLVPIAVLLVAPSLIGSGTQPTLFERAAAVTLTLAATYWAQARSSGGHRGVRSVS